MKSSLPIAVRKRVVLPIKKNSFTIVHHSVDGVTKNSSEANPYDRLNTIQLENQYREYHSLPFVEDMISLREMYGVSGRKISEILCLGSNVYKSYENGEMPSLSCGRLLMAIFDSNTYMRFLKLSCNKFSTYDYTKLTSKAIRAHALLEKMECRRGFLSTDSIFTTRNRFNGYKLVDLEYLAAVLSYLSKYIKLYEPLWVRILCYVDFLGYKRSGKSITGLAYSATKNAGIVVYRHNFLVEQLQQLGFASSAELVDVVGGSGLPYGLLTVDASKVSSVELPESHLSVLNVVIERFKSFLPADMVSYSIAEPIFDSATQESNSCVPYQPYAFDIEGFE